MLMPAAPFSATSAAAACRIRSRVARPFAVAGAFVGDIARVAGQEREEVIDRRAGAEADMHAATDDGQFQGRRTSPPMKARPVRLHARKVRSSVLTRSRRRR